LKHEGNARMPAQSQSKPHSVADKKTGATLEARKAIRGCQRKGKKHQTARPANVQKITLRVRAKTPTP
ncbi:hypothetical protein, partial [Paraburkholderia hospita]|uniref:hypothetical protein n=1 Tax=Paraburkholderia hospita TaxID=169430 RepID=UPI001A98CF5F